MPSDSPIPPPGESLLAWRQKYPEAADELVRAVNKLISFEAQLVAAGAAPALKAGAFALRDAGDKFTFYLPIAIPYAISNADGTGSGASDQLNLLLNGLRQTAILPTG